MASTSDPTPAPRHMETTTLLELVALGALGGALTTIAGMGGGLFLVLSLSALLGPLAALAVTTPALLASNAHRAWLFRDAIDAGVVRRFALGAGPAALMGGLAAARVPPWAVQASMVCLAAVALGRALGWVRVAPRAGVFVPASAAVGFVAAASGGAGFLAGPLLLSVGLAGAPYVGTSAASAVVLHGARLLGYRAGGIVDVAHAPAAVALLVGLVLGNVAGKRLRGGLSSATERRLELGALVVCAALGVLGVGLR